MMIRAHALLLCLLMAAETQGADEWYDSFYQYRIPVTIQADTPGWHTVPLTSADIVRAVNVNEQLAFDPTWFAFNQVKVVEVDDAGRTVNGDFDAGFALVLDEQQLIPADALDGSREQLDLPVEPGANYLLRYINEGGGASPVLRFEPLYPVTHKLQTTAYLTSHEPRMLPLARTSREVLIVPNTATMPLRVRDAYITGLKDISLQRAQIVFAAYFDKPGQKRLVLYYQPLTGRFLTVPQRRLDAVPLTHAKIERLGPAEKYEGITQYRLPGTEEVSVWFAETTVKLTPDMKAPAAESSTIRLTSAANEAQSFQLVLQPRQMLEFRGMQSSDLVGPSGKITAEAIRVQRVEYVPITEPSFLSPVRHRGLIGDALTEAHNQGLSPIDGNAGYWLTVRIPAGAAAGVYRGKVTVDLGASRLELPIEVEVYGFELPEFSPFRSSMGGAHLTKAFFDGEKTVADYHGVTSKSDLKKLARGYYDEMARNKFTPHNVAQYSDIGMNWTPPPQGYNIDSEGNDFKLHDWDFTEFNRDLAHYIDKLKVNAFTLVHVDPTSIPIFMHLPGAELETYNRHPQYSSLSWQTFREMTMVGYDKREKDQYIEITKSQYNHLVRDFYRAIAENLQQHGWLDYAYILSDETAERGYKPYLDFIKLLKSDPLTARIQHVWCLQDSPAFNFKADPADPNYAFNNLLDVYLPETNENHHFWEKYYFTDYDIDQKREKLWNYVTYSSRVAIDAPGINNRAIALEVFNNGGSGFLIWGTFIWDSKAHQESNHDNPWEQPWTRWGNGAMSYFYPPRKAGPASQPDFTIVPSLRVETYRESVDDFEYAWMLEKAIADARTRGLDVSEQQDVLDDIQRFFPEMVQWSQNDAWYLELRDRMARAIVQLKK